MFVKDSLSYIILGAYDSDASALAWFDSDGDGRFDFNEPLIQGVCMWASTTLRIYDQQEIVEICEDAEFYEAFHTNSLGLWPYETERYMTFFAGASCNDIYIYALPPEGFNATTPLIVNGCSGAFGFAPENVSPQNRALSHEAYVERQEREGMVRLTILILSVVALIAIGSAIFVKKWG